MAIFNSPLSLAACMVLLFSCFAPCLAAESQLEQALAELNVNVLPASESLGDMLESDIRQRFRQVNQQSIEDWQAVKTRGDWEQFRNAKIAQLRASLHLPDQTDRPIIMVIQEDLPEKGYLIRKLTFQSRPGWEVTANLYLPTEKPEKMPGILISHSHHNPKTQSELQQMGALWARAGCAVLIPDHQGHGERRQHPFISSADYPEKFQVSRQDYYFRYNTAMQLYACGESLMGWMVWDLIRGLDLLCSLPHIDHERIALLGAVAGGGDPAAVTAALDERVTVLVPFNFGGPQPETRFPLPTEDADFNFIGGGSWESTRNLHRSASAGFLPWVIVGSVAPRGLIHAHEFAWDQAHDPVWRRYQTIFAMYDAGQRLAFTHGHGSLKQSSAEASHCNNIGREHRAAIHRYFVQQWNLHDEAYWQREEQRDVHLHDAKELHGLKDGSRLVPLRSVLKQQLESRSTKASWKDVLGNVAPYEIRIVKEEQSSTNGIQVRKYLLGGERNIRVPVVLLIPEKLPAPFPVTVCISQPGKSNYLHAQAADVAQKLQSSAVCLVDVRGTGESAPGDDRGRRSNATSLAASELMLGEPLMAGQLRDLRSVLSFLRSHFKPQSIHLEGASGAKRATKLATLQEVRPLDVAQPPPIEILGPTLVLLTCYFEAERLQATATGGIPNYRSLLDSAAVPIPFDAIIPGAIPAGDLEELIRGAQARHDLRVVISPAAD